MKMDLVCMWHTDTSVIVHRFPKFYGEVDNCFEKIEL